MVLAVVTPSLADRANLRTDCIESVRAQKVPVDEHAICVDAERLGPAVVRNQLVESCFSEWVGFLDDDDVWYPHHVETIQRHLIRGRYDVVYTLANVVGRPGWDPQRRSFNAAALRECNYIPLCGVTVRRELFLSVGGFPTEGRYEDHGLLVRLLDAGARFLCVPEVTWEYRFGEWDSRSKEVWRGER